MTTTILFIVVFVGYLIYITIREGKILPSISDSYYDAGPKAEIIFTLWCFVLGFIIMSFEATTPFFALGGSGLLFVGAAAMFRDLGLTKAVHFGGALLCIISAFFGLFYEYGTYLGGAIWVSFTAYAYLFNIKNIVWWVEVVAFLLVAYVKVTQAFF